MTPAIAIVSPGAMGSAVARVLVENGARVLTSCAGRGPATLGRAGAAGMIDAGDDELAGADVILSIVPPASAVAVAERFAAPLARSGHRPCFVDCNAISVRTVEAVAGILGAGPARFVDGAFIGTPPEPGKPGPTLFLAGEPARDLSWLKEYGLDIQVIAGPVGAASALKMSYAGITKGLMAIGAAMILASIRADAAAPLHEELAARQPQLLKRFATGLPDMFSKARRWAEEMREIAAFVEDDPAAAKLYLAAGEFYEQLAADHAGAQVDTGRIGAFLRLGD